MCEPKVLWLSLSHLPPDFLDREGGIEHLEGVSAGRDPHGVLLSVPADIDQQLSDHGYRPMQDAAPVSDGHEVGSARRMCIP